MWSPSVKAGCFLREPFSGSPGSCGSSTGYGHSGMTGPCPRGSRTRSSVTISPRMARFGSQLSRWIGYLGAVVQGVSATFWLPYYPVWALIYIAIAVMVFYALARYGGREDSI